MRTIGLIAEGITDHAVLENMLSGFFGDTEVEFNPLVPLRDKTDQTRVPEGEFSNWELVFEYCASSKFKEALAYVDLIVVHVDVGMGDHPNFGVALAPGGVLRAAADLVAATRAVLIGKISQQVYAANQQKICFAVPVLDTPCWLLPIYISGAACKAQQNCEKRLIAALKKQNWAKAHAKTYKIYDELSKPYRKKAKLDECRQSRPSVDLFLASLPNW